MTSKQGYNQIRSQFKDQKGDHANADHKFCDVLNGFLDSLDIAGTDIVADDRLTAQADADHNRHDNSEDFHDDANHCQRDHCAEGFACACIGLIAIPCQQIIVDSNNHND